MPGPRICARFADGTLVALVPRVPMTPSAPTPSRRQIDPIDHRFLLGRARTGAERVAGAAPRVCRPDGLLPHEEDYTGLGTIDPGDPDALWISTVVDPRNGTERPSTRSSTAARVMLGESWTWTPVTEGSATANFRPIAVPGDPSREVLAWYRGTMQSSQAYDTEVLVRVAERRRE